MPEDTRTVLPGPVVHVVRRHGLVSETFVIDAMRELDALGWSAWVATRAVDPANPYSFPSPDRIFVAGSPKWRAQVTDAVLLRGYGRRREVEWTLPPTAASARLVHAHFGWAALDALPLAQRLGRPVVATFHGSDATVFPRIPRRERLHPRSMRNSHKYSSAFDRLAQVIVVSAFIEGRLRELGFTGQANIIPAGVRLDEFRFRGALPIADALRLIFVGRIVRQKGLDLLLRALPMVLSQKPRVRLDVVGDGPQLAACVQLVDQLDLEDVVKFHGAQSRARVLEVMNRSHIQIMASRTMRNGAAEGSPVVSKEALAIGLPLVATDNGGTRETLPPEHRHELVAEEDVDGLAAAIVRLGRDEASWPERVARGREWVASEFDWKRLARKTASVYEAAVSDLPR